MDTTAPGTRRLAVTLIVLLAALLLPTAAPAAAADGAALEIHSRVCPVAFAGPDFYGECHDDPLADITFTLTLVGTGVVDAATTPATGDLVFDALPLGTYEVQSSVPGDFASFRAYCSDQDSAEVPFSYTDTGGIRLDLAVAGAQVVCDWYTVPADSRGDAEASVTIYKAVCPAGYTGTDYFDDCFDTPLPGIDFTFRRADSDNAVGDTTDANGFVAFEAIGQDGTYVVTEDIPGEFNDFVVYCSANGAAFPFAYADGANGIVLDLTVADDLRCDWYNIPEDLRGETPTPIPTRAPTTSKPPVSTLPNTGDGAAAIGPERATLPVALLIPLAMLALGAGVANARLSARPTPSGDRRRS